MKWSRAFRFSSVAFKAYASLNVRLISSTQNHIYANIILIMYILQTKRQLFATDKITRSNQFSWDYLW